ncbi:hypothetical protein L3E10_002357 [Escherichia coli]|nr:hypothetical protein [Escherichia coli]
MVYLLQGIFYTPLKYPDHKSVRLAADISGNRGKISEEDTTETPMYVNRGGRLTILQEDQGQLLTLAGEPDGKLRAAGR